VSLPRTLLLNKDRFHGFLLHDTIGSLALLKLQENSFEFADLIYLLGSKKAVLILPSRKIPEGFVDLRRNFFEDHIFVTQKIQSSVCGISLSGIKGLFQK